MNQLVSLIKELSTDADPRVKITTDQTDLVKLVSFSTRDAGFPVQREVSDIPGGQAVTFGARACATTR